jgi:hypothetical protein
MSPRRILAGLVAAAALVAPSGAPAYAAKPSPAPPTITSAVAVDSRTVDLTWTPTKGADHYVVVAPLVGPIYTTATSVRVTGLYPGDEQVFHVEAETRRNAPLGSSDWVYVATPPEGPTGTLGWVDAYDGYVRIWSGSGIGCVTQDLGREAADGTYTSLGEANSRDQWLLFQGSGTTETYAVRCQGSGGFWSPWSEPTVVSLS